MIRPRILATASPTTIGAASATPPIGTKTQMDILLVYRQQGLPALEPRRHSFDDSKGVDAGAETLGAAVVPLYEYLQVVRIEDGSMQTHAHLHLQQLDALAFGG